MKHLNMTSLLARIALERDDELLQLTAAMSDGKKTSGNPMAIRFKPAVGDFIVLMSGRLGISAAALVNIMIEGVMRETLTPHQAAVTRIPERFWLLMDEYNLSSPEVAHLLADWNMSLGVLENRERTLGYMTAPLLEKLSEWFYVSTGWLSGKIVPPVQITVFPDWFDAARLLTCRIQEINPEDIIARPDLFFIRKKEQDDIFLFIRRYRTINDTRFRVVECAGRCSVSGESGKQFTSFLAMCGLLFKAEVLFLVDTFIDSGNILDSMISGEVLPPAALREIQKPFHDTHGKYTQRIWSTDEREPFFNPDNFINDEWRKIAEDIISTRSI